MMTIIAFKDSKDGYYQLEHKNGDPLPSWTSGLIPCDVVSPNNIQQVPQVIEALQGLLALNNAGYASFYESWANSPDRTFAQKAFINKALHWKRDDPTLNSAASDLGLTSEQVDSLFVLAATL